MTLGSARCENCGSRFLVPPKVPHNVVTWEMSRWNRPDSSQKCFYNPTQNDRIGWALFCAEYIPG